MKNKVLSEIMAQGCLIAFLLFAMVQCATAQTETVRGPITHPPKHYGPLVKWNNSDFFKDKKCPKLFDWKTYPETWDGKQFLTWGMFAAAGVLWGYREAYHADPTVFEKTYDVAPESFWGSDAWKRNYQDNDPEKPHKQEYLGNVGRDIWHTFGFAHNTLLFSGAFTIGARRQPWKYKALNLWLGLGARSLLCTLVYNSLRARAK